MIENELQCEDPHMVETFNPLKPKILILGHGEHGKGTVSSLLCSLYGHSTCSSSTVAFPWIYPTLVASRGYKNQHEAMADKKNERMLWKEAISLLNSPDKSTLARLILDNASIYDGMRCDKEYEAAAHLFDHIIWVDASSRKPKDPSMAITFHPDKMLYLDNNGPEDVLARKIANLYESYIGE